MKLTILVPVFNEEKTIEKLINEIRLVRLPEVEKEIIIIDDGSTDKTLSIIKKAHVDTAQFKLIRLPKNMGKGNAIKVGVKEAKGDYIIIQDADLEYNPNDIYSLLKPIIEGKARVVYGTRLKRMPNFKRDERTIIFFIHYIGNKLLSLLTSILYGQWITDMETGYKILPADLFKSLKLISKGFEIEPEITAKLLKKGHKIYELPISTNPRGYNEGKKLNTVKDGMRALYTLIRFRFVN